MLQLLRLRTVAVYLPSILFKHCNTHLIGGEPKMADLNMLGIVAVLFILLLFL
jgi:hypothetical protein